MSHLEAKNVFTNFLGNILKQNHFKINRINQPPVSATSGLYYKPMMIVNDDSRVVNKLEASLTDDTGVVIYNCHMFIVQATGGSMDP
jgi:hypothetical protein